jgi:hypothetical protein
MLCNPCKNFNSLFTEIEKSIKKFPGKHKKP